MTGTTDFRNWSSSAKIDPLLLDLLLEKMQQKAEIDERKTRPQSFAGLVAVYTGVAVMVLVILLGVLRAQDVDDVLTNACFALVFFCGIGFLFGKIIDSILRESSKSMIREMIQRTESNVSSDAPLEG